MTSAQRGSQRISLSCGPRRALPLDAPPPALRSAPASVTTEVAHPLRDHAHSPRPKVRRSPDSVPVALPADVPAGQIRSQVLWSRVHIRVHNAGCLPRFPHHGACARGRFGLGLAIKRSLNRVVPLSERRRECQVASRLASTRYHVSAQPRISPPNAIAFRK